MLVTDSSLDWQSAQTIAAAACQYADQHHLRICAWVLDRHGNPLAMQRINNAPLPSTEIARGKAFTAVSFGFATHLWQSRLAEKPHLLSGLNVQEGVVMFGGGLPIRYNGELVGSIGVSGASEAQDQACAEAGIAAISELDQAR
ncbi:GlcG/HbpS family heme-binding protein [Neptuniibacter halophilus]|uniref:GlcG/HbpS family heme-binding protein n=1 Tax=Neptuniibacter halophilus TaxID=651666 RepID=UPI0025731D2B|nr:heme-binding protein [Neptuniibacter halophilus]